MTCTFSICPLFTDLDLDRLLQSGRQIVFRLGGCGFDLDLIRLTLLQSLRNLDDACLADFDLLVSADPLEGHLTGAFRLRDFQLELLSGFDLLFSRVILVIWPAALSIVSPAMSLSTASKSSEYAL